MIVKARALFAAVALFLFGCQNTTDPTVPVCDEWTTTYMPMPVQIGRNQTIYTLTPIYSCGHSHEVPNPHYRGTP